jgi:VCBS repeat-containing protein
MSTINGTNGDNTLTGTSGDDRIDAKAGDDVVSGADGNDDVKGGSGDDLVDGGGGSDEVDGGSGDDIAVYVAAENAGAHDEYDGGSHSDTLRLVLTQAEFDSAAVQADLADYQAFVSSGAIGWFQFTAFDLEARKFEHLDVVISDPNQAPAADAVEATGDEDAASIAITLTGTDPDAGDAVDTFTVSSLPANGTLYTDATLTTEVVVGTAYSASGNSLTFYFVPDADFNGDASFDYTASDGDVDSPSATATIHVAAVNDPATISGTNTGDVTEAGGDVSFAAAANYTVGAYPSPNNMGIADVNHDGHVDIVSANYSSGNISVLLGDGAGNFAAGTSFATAFGEPQNAEIGDMNGDTHADVVMAHGNPNQVSVMTGDGAGAFTTLTSFATGMGFTNDAKLSDIDDDGDLDVIVAGRDTGFSNSIVSVWTNDGSGVFTAAGSYTVSTSDRPAGRFVMADMNGDGFEDVVLVNAGNTGGTGGNPNISVLINDQTGFFGTSANYTIALPAGAYAPGVAVADLNGDGMLDFVVGDVVSDELLVLLSDGLGGFDPATGYTSGGADPNGVALADFDGDGDADIVTTNSGSNTAGVLLNDGDGLFGAPETFTLGTGTGPSGVSAADLNGDTLADVVTANTGSADLSVLLNTSDASPGSPFASGDLDVADVDTGEAKFQPVAAAALEGMYGDFTFDHETGAWTYTLDNDDPDTQALDDGDTVEDTLLVTSHDGTDTETITVTIHGAYDLIV